MREAKISYQQLTKLNSLKLPTNADNLHLQSVFETCISMFKISRQNLNFKCAVVHLYSYHRLTGLLGQATSAGKRGTLV